MKPDETTRPTASLGELLSEHRLRRELRLLYQFLSTVGIGGALVMVTVGFLRAYIAYQNYGPALVWRWAMPFWIAGLCLAVLGMSSILALWQRYAITVRAFANGMTYQQRRKVQVYFWRNVRSVRTAAARYILPFLGAGGRSELLLTMSDRRVLQLTNKISNLDRLVEAIKERVYPRMMSDYVKAFRMGQPLAFGPLTLTLDGIRYGKLTVPWDRVRGTEIARGKLSILWEARQHVSRLSVQTKRIPNVEICFQLVRRLGLHP